MKAILRCENIKSKEEVHLKIEGQEWNIENFYDEVLENRNDVFDEKRLKELLNEFSITLLEIISIPNLKIDGWMEISKNECKAYGFGEVHCSEMGGD
ncbi:hypothetical protein M0910_001941 [Listeria monocytogenes]|nr:hypothetical protein [Listeria monocytogenes]EJA0930861.1 hypothetical protein [Listeria monocytogenes]EJA1052376.1 hypothetical protein [Listeria monocytogenes]EJA1073843.1 hypothetical protein [Listeria monocytogenes]EJC8829963.1 hypothetical protein [Listeria monocytogenes]